MRKLFALLMLAVAMPAIGASWSTTLGGAQLFGFAEDVSTIELGNVATDSPPINISACTSANVTGLAYGGKVALFACPALTDTPASGCTSIGPSSVDATGSFSSFPISTPSPYLRARVSQLGALPMKLTLRCSRAVTVR